MSGFSKERALIAVALLAGACAGPTHRVHPEAASRWEGLRTVGVVQPAVPVYELDASGNLEEKPDWTEAAENNLAQAIASELTVRGVKPFSVVSSMETEPELVDAMLLFEAVTRDVLFANYVVPFVTPHSGFRYSLGDLSSLARSYDVDGFVFAVGQGQNSSGGRTASEVAKTVVGALLAILSGGGGAYEPQFGVDWLAIGLVDARGDLLWFGVYDSGGGDLRSLSSATNLTRAATHEMPVKAPGPQALPKGGP